MPRRRFFPAKPSSTKPFEVVLDGISHRFQVGEHDSEDIESIAFMTTCGIWGRVGWLHFRVRNTFDESCCPKCWQGVPLDGVA